MVYVVQAPEPRRNQDGTQSTRDVTPAMKYGQLCVLLDSGDVTLSPGPVMMQLKAKLRDFTDEDHLLLIGDPVAIGMATSVAMLANHGRAKVLRWMKREHDYLPIQLDAKAGRA